MNHDNEDKTIKIFNQKEIRTHWDEVREKWWFSVVDIIGVLTESENPQVYWRVLKKRLLDEGNETVTNCNGLKMMALDGKMRMTDVLDTEGVLRLVQSIPSPKAEPFKLWLAKVGNERIDEIVDPEIAIERALEFYQKKGYSLNWINQRLKSIEIRKELTDEWDKHGVKKGTEYAILTDEITRAWSEMTTRQYKDYKGLTRENLRDNMTNMELVLNMLAEASATEISKEEDPEALKANLKVAKRGGSVAKAARIELEKQTGRKVTSRKNAKDILELDVKDYDKNRL